MNRRLPWYISPCPNDTFITYAMNTGKIPMPFELDIHFADVEVLNSNVVRSIPCVGKISVAVLAQCQETYTLLRTGAAMGLSCGPLIVAREDSSPERYEYGRIAIPGKYTTANALCSLYEKFKGERVPMLFSDIIPAIQNNEVDLGILIHESRFQYAEYGLKCLVDLGAFWEQNYAMPLPLGIFVVHNSLLEYKDTIEVAMQSSLQYAYEHYEETLEYCAQYAQEIEKSTLQQHITTFVNDYSIDMGNEGREAIEQLLKALQ